MAVFFGTDGIRGKININLTHDLAFKCGNALTFLKEKPVVAICRDTRRSGVFLLSSFSAGLMCGGGNLVDCGIMPTPGLSFVTAKYNADFGVVISASHNTSEYNGIKIFDRSGCKLSEELENRLEGFFSRINIATDSGIGTIKQDKRATGFYIGFLVSAVKNGLKGLKIVLDCANGAAYAIAPKAFRKTGCTVIAANCSKNGEINGGCGSLFPDQLRENVLRHKADMGFAFDGDADRILACDENGNIIDGDRLVKMSVEYAVTSHGIEGFYFVPSWRLEFDDSSKNFSYSMVTGVKN